MFILNASLVIIVCVACIPELSYVVVACFPICGADHAHAVAGLELSELQQHYSQVMYEQLRVHE